jgi:acyl-coenzyme A thioesterase PaaI-like protein
MADSIEARRRLAAATRLVMERMVASRAPADMLDAAAQRMESFAETLAEYPYGRTYEGFAEPANAPRPQEFFDHSPLSGTANPIAAPMRMEVVDERTVHGTVRFGAAYEGPPGSLHGGFVAAVHDEILGLANSLNGNAAMTGTLTVVYRMPTPLHTDLRIEATFDGVDGRKQYCSSRLYAGDALCNEAEGIFVTIDRARFMQMVKERDARG